MNKRFLRFLFPLPAHHILCYFDVLCLIFGNCHQFAIHPFTHQCLAKGHMECSDNVAWWWSKNYVTATLNLFHIRLIFSGYCCTNRHIYSWNRQPEGVAFVEILLSSMSQLLPRGSSVLSGRRIADFHRWGGGRLQAYHLYEPISWGKPDTVILHSK